jgi:hypothetical protein
MNKHNELRHDRPLPELHLHDLIAKIAVNRETGIDEPEAATVQPQPPVVIPRMPVRVKRPFKEAR